MKESLHQEYRFSEHWFFRARRTIFGRVLDALVPLRAGARVLEVGPGSGVNVPVLVERGKLTILDVSRLIVQTGHNRIPLYEGSLDTVVGILYARDVLRVLQGGNTSVELRDIALTPNFVPETKKAHELLREFLGSSFHFALVADEYGGVEGVVTLHSLPGVNARP